MKATFQVLQTRICRSLYMLICSWVLAASAQFQLHLVLLVSNLGIKLLCYLEDHGT